jgi:hypothetical protein
VLILFAYSVELLQQVVIDFAVVPGILVEMAWHQNLGGLPVMLIGKLNARSKFKCGFKIFPRQHLQLVKCHTRINDLDVAKQLRNLRWLHDPPSPKPLQDAQPHRFALAVILLAGW